VSIQPLASRNIKIWGCYDVRWSKGRRWSPARDRLVEREAHQKPTYDAATSKRVPTEEEQQIKTDLHYAFTDNCRRPAPDMESSAQ